jgi:hypothetical protein
VYCGGIALRVHCEYRALVLLGFAGAFRRYELVGLDVDDCVCTKDGLTVTLRRSKTDPDGAGRKIGIPPVQVPTSPVTPILDAPLETALDLYGL